MTIYRKCTQCKKEILVEFISRDRKFCSRECCWEFKRNKSFTGISFSWKGKKFSEEHIKKISVANKGKKRSEESKKKMSLARKGCVISNEIKEKIKQTLLNKNKTPSYRALHKRIEKSLGKVNKCSNQNCNKISNKFEWANVSGKYGQDLSDWIRLCASCHRQYDNYLLPKCP